MNTPVRVLVVDDSATMRALIRAALGRRSDLTVVGEAGDPLEAREAIRALNPDVITLDVEMPNMNGLEFLQRLMRLKPMPVVMVSTLTHRGAEATLAALELGAVDCVGKPTGPNDDSFERLADTVAAAARARPMAPQARSLSVPAQSYSPGDRIVALGASTGGVEALLTVLSGFPANCPPTVITQHMPPNFTASFAARLDRVCAPTVTEASEGAELRPGHVYIAPGGLRHLEVRRLGDRLSCRLSEGDPVTGHRPSVDVLFRSVASAVGARAVGALLTGMGRDGAQGLLEMRQAGAATIGQDENTCVVFGMPRAAAEIGAVERQLPLNRIAAGVLNAAAKTLPGAA